MKREIKFRAWDEVLKFMMYGEDIEKSDNIKTGLSYGKLFIAYAKPNGDWQELEIMQYTGIKDRNGKEIYEGDRIRITDEYGNDDSGIVEYITERAAYGFRYREDSNMIIDPSAKDIIEVIGNIYENPELVDEQNL